MVLPFTFNLRTGNATKSNIGAVVSILTGIAYYLFHIYSAYYQMISQKDSNFVSTLIDSYNQYAGCSFLMGILINAAYYQSDVVKVIGIIQRVDAFSLDQRNSDSRPAMLDDRFMLKFHGPAYVFVTGLCVMEYYYCIMFIKDTPTFSTYCLLMCYVPLLVHITTELTFCALVLCITDRLSQLRTSPAPVPHTALKRNWEALVEAATLLSHCFRIPILMLTFHQFTAITTLTYDLCVAVIKYDSEVPGFDLQKISEQLKSSGGWSLFFIAETFILCLFCHRLKAEITRSGSWLQQQMHRTRSSRGRWAQLQIASSTKDEFNVLVACELFSIDLQLFYNMIGIITTYLIILVQFDVAQRHIQH